MTPELRGDILGITAFVIICSLCILGSWATRECPPAKECARAHQAKPAGSAQPRKKIDGMKI